MINRLFNTRVTRVVHDEAHVTLETDAQVRVIAKLLIAADGVSSMIRESAGIATTQVNYDQPMNGLHLPVRWRCYRVQGLT